MIKIKPKTPVERRQGYFDIRRVILMRNCLSYHLNASAYERAGRKVRIGNVPDRFKKGNQKYEAVE